jgi:hypothetical protein
MQKKDKKHIYEERASVETKKRVEKILKAWAGLSYDEVNSMLIRLSRALHERSVFTNKT